MVLASRPSWERSLRSSLVVPAVIVGFGVLAAGVAVVRDLPALFWVGLAATVVGALSATRRTADHHPSPWWVVVQVGVVVLAAVAGAGAGDWRPSLPIGWELEADEPVVHGRVGDLVMIDDAVHDVDDGDVRWRIDGQVSGIADRTVLVATEEGMIEARALDDGRIRWSVPAPPGSEYGGPGVVTGASLLIGGRAIALADGRTLWEKPGVDLIGALEEGGRGDGADVEDYVLGHVRAAQNEGREVLDVLRVADGRVVVPVPEGADNVIVRDDLLLFEPAGGGLSAIGLPGGETRWSVPQDVGDGVVGRAGSPLPILGDDYPVPTALDLVTGRMSKPRIPTGWSYATDSTSGARQGWWPVARRDGRVGWWSPSRDRLVDLGLSDDGRRVDASIHGDVVAALVPRENALGTITRRLVIVRDDRRIEVHRSSAEEVVVDDDLALFTSGRSSRVVDLRP